MKSNTLKYTVQNHIKFFIILSALLSPSHAFDDWNAFSFGTNLSENGARDRANALIQLNPGRIAIAGGVDDSVCCKMPSGELVSDANKGGSAWLGVVDPAKQSLSDTILWGFLRGVNYPMWNGLAAHPSDGYFSVGSIGDTVFFTGTERVSQHAAVPDTFNSSNWHEVIRRGGGGGIGIGRWSTLGLLEKLQLLRFDFTTGLGNGVSVGRNIRIIDDRITISGNIGADSPGQLWEGNDSFPISSGSLCFTYSMDTSGANKWLTTTPCIRAVPSEHISQSGNVWMTATDTFAGPASVTGHPTYRGWRPALVKLDIKTGTIIDRRHPMGDMQGMARALAADESGRMLLIGEQSSGFTWNGSHFEPIIDTTFGIRFPRPTATFMALVDSTGTLQRFKQLHGLDNAEGWKILRIPGAGWLLLTRDEYDMIGWSRLYLFDDSLNLADSSPRLPCAMDIAPGFDGRILIAGTSRPTDSAPAWLSGTGSVWVGSFKLGPNSTAPVHFQAASSKSSMQQTGKYLSFKVTDLQQAIIQVYTLNGGLIFQRSVNSTTTMELPLGTSMCRLVTKSSILTKKFVRLE